MAFQDPNPQGLAKSTPLKHWQSQWHTSVTTNRQCHPPLNRAYNDLPPLREVGLLLDAVAMSLGQRREILQAVEAGVPQ